MLWGPHSIRNALLCLKIRKVHELDEISLSSSVYNLTNTSMSNSRLKEIWGLLAVTTTIKKRAIASSCRVVYKICMWIFHEDIPSHRCRARREKRVPKIFSFFGNDFLSHTHPSRIVHCCCWLNETENRMPDMSISFFEFFNVDSLFFYFDFSGRFTLIFPFFFKRKRECPPAFASFATAAETFYIYVLLPARRFDDVFLFIWKYAIFRIIMHFISSLFPAI